MRTYHVVIVAAIVMAVICNAALPASAVDFGASITGAYSGTANGGDHGKPGHDGKKIMDGYKLGINLMADTILDKNQLMNLRITVGYMNGMLSGPGPRNINFFSTHSLNSILWTNTLGFGIIKKENLRFWVGPQLAMSVDFQKGGMGFPPRGRNRDGFHTSMFGYLGVVTGVNYSPVKNVFLTAEIGLRGGCGGSLETTKLKMKKIEPFVNLGFLYRVDTGRKSAVE
jgi:hypothetical protein